MDSQYHAPQRVSRLIFQPFRSGSCYILPDIRLYRYGGLRCGNHHHQPAFRKIFAQLGISPRGGGRRRQLSPLYAPEMDMAIRKARDLGKHISYFGPEANDFACWSKRLRSTA